MCITGHDCPQGTHYLALMRTKVSITALSVISLRNATSKALEVMISE